MHNDSDSVRKTVKDARAARHVELSVFRREVPMNVPVRCDPLQGPVRIGQMTGFPVEGRLFQDGPVTLLTEGHGHFLDLRLLPGMTGWIIRDDDERCLIERFRSRADTYGGARQDVIPVDGIRAAHLELGPYLFLLLFAEPGEEPVSPFPDPLPDVASDTEHETVPPPDDPAWGAYARPSSARPVSQPSRKQEEPKVVRALRIRLRVQDTCRAERILKPGEQFRINESPDSAFTIPGHPSTVVLVDHHAGKTFLRFVAEQGWKLSVKRDGDVQPLFFERLRERDRVMHVGCDIWQVPFTDGQAMIRIGTHTLLFRWLPERDA